MEQFVYFGSSSNSPYWTNQTGKYKLLCDSFNQRYYRVYESGLVEEIKGKNSFLHDSIQFNLFYKTTSWRKTKKIIG